MRLLLHHQRRNSGDAINSMENEPGLGYQESEKSQAVESTGRYRLP